MQRTIGRAQDAWTVANSTRYCTAVRHCDVGVSLFEALVFAYSWPAGFHGGYTREQTRLKLIVELTVNASSAQRAHGASCFALGEAFPGAQRYTVQEGTPTGKHSRRAATQRPGQAHVSSASTGTQSSLPMFSSVRACLACCGTALSAQCSHPMQRAQVQPPQRGPTRLTFVAEPHPPIRAHAVVRGAKKTRNAHHGDPGVKHYTKPIRVYQGLASQSNSLICTDSGYCMATHVAHSGCRVGVSGHSRRA
ncbi:hypothetical protein B0H10DRAFT_640652 [Mycena sp. CBHHK59/15]|nr:hypothetical protein B0H10DRAFT_640652 [Mycena sp. CBHHK59/15]